MKGIFRAFCISCCICLPASCAFASSVQDIETVDQQYVKDNTGKDGIVLLDVRTSDVFNGKSPRDGIPGGHIQGAVNFALASLDEDGADEALKAIGVTKDVTVIVYCNTGKTSTKFAEALVEKHGFDAGRIKNYKGSMTDWSSDPANPILTK